jgi:hypothetical protein
MKASNIIISSLCLIAGGAAGFFISKNVYKKKYQQYADEEIESVKKVYAKHFGGGDQPKEGDNSDKEIPPKETFGTRSSLDDVGDGQPRSGKRVIDYTAPYKSGDPVVRDNRPLDEALEPKNIYILTPEEFRASTNPSTTLFYYKDGVLADDDYNIIKHPEEVVGPEALNAFGRYEDDAVYVRNETTKMDYEILLDNRSYIDVSPHGSGAPSDD